MKNKLKARTPILALILFVFAVGYTFAANKVVVIPMAGDPAPQSLAVFATGSAETLTTALTALTSVSMTAPSNGIVIVNSTAQASETTAGDGVQWGINTVEEIDSLHLQHWVGSGTGYRAPISGTRGFNVMADASYTFRLMCKHTGSSSSTAIMGSEITAIFTPNL